MLNTKILWYTGISW